MLRIRISLRYSLRYRSPCLLNNYSESLNSLYELQRYLSAKMISMPGQPYPNTYIDLLVSNVGKMLAQAGLGLRYYYY